MKLLLPLTLLSPISAGILVPPPTGPYAVASKVQEIIDPNRTEDPILPDSRSKGRRLLFSVFMPVKKPEKQYCRVDIVPYMTPKVATDYGKQAAAAGLSSDLYSVFSMEFCNLNHISPCGGAGRSTPKYPVVLFTPGLGESRMLYGAGARSLASHGYVVVTVDHPYETNFVEFPDGTSIQGHNIAGNDTAAIERLVEVRTADLSFLIDQLHNRTLVKPLLGSFSGSLDLSRLVVYSHSLGGAAAATLTRTNKRVLGGIDIDGQLVNPIKSLRLNKPFLLAGRYNHSSTDPTWNQFWPHLTGPRMELAINGTAHGSFTDRPLLVSALSLPESAMKSVEGLIGSIDGRRLDEIVNGVLISFFDYVFCKRDQELKRLPKRYAEVSVPRYNL
ncbi:hypothetical protein QQS21_002894 [Conoideocrella luteorostrata]|uniref:1-alkyl-2-acetylglycerophosphocholine esterase n=1 Tax=Conoideocrella luteorostrata TaxID=1105319 RepID=A0AAJ0CXB4_9HYPO|nr:hypothetical protein QQS21_002894 [Conoideocrella luteorostrata]